MAEVFYSPRSNNPERNHRELSLNDLACDGLPFSGSLRSFIEQQQKEDVAFTLNSEALNDWWENTSCKISNHCRFSLGDFNASDLEQLQKALLGEENTLIPKKKSLRSWIVRFFSRTQEVCEESSKSSSLKD